MNQTDTIAAISTPLAAGGLGVVRISGPQAKAVAARVFRPVGRRTIENVPGFSAIYGRVFEGERPIDEAIATVYTAPKSYTGEDVVELSCHGGVYIMRQVLRACLAAGARAAQAGEFTKRAFLGGKMTLTQAEAVMDLIAAQGQQASQAALSARDGAIFQAVSSIRSRLVTLSGQLAAWVDYPEEDIPQVDPSVLLASLVACCREMDRLLESYDTGRILREGVETVIAGRPNVGKSTLMNLLSGVEKSIVTDIPGTTRDIVEEQVMVGDLILNIADTAGLRRTSDPVEQIGVALANKRLENSYLVLAVFDSSQPLDEEDRRLLEAVRGRPCVAVVNKTDLGSVLNMEEIRSHVPLVVEMSAKEKEGVLPLQEAIAQALHLCAGDSGAAILANERQRECLIASRGSLQDAVAALEMGTTLDAVDVCIDQAIDHLLQLTGERATQAVVDEVFSHFCVGK